MIDGQKIFYDLLPVFYKQSSVCERDQGDYDFWRAENNIEW